MPSLSLDRLPPELIVRVSDQLTQDGRKNLSLSNSVMRSAMVPLLFRGLRVNCPLPKDHILHHVVQKFGPHVLNLHLHVSFFPNPGSSENGEPDVDDQGVDMDADEDEKYDEQDDENDEEEENEGDGDNGSDDGASSREGLNSDDDEEEPGNGDDDADEDDDKNEEDEDDAPDQDDAEEPKWYWENPPDSVWAREAIDVPAVKDLIEFKGLPSCSTLSLHTMGDEKFEFDADWDDNDLADGGMYFCSYPENWDEVKQKEEKYTWRAAMRDMWHDVAAISKTKHLKVFSFLPRKASSWMTTEWSEFLGRLKELTLYAYGAENGAGWHVNTLPGFDNFFQELSTNVFEHAKNLNRLKIVAHEDGFLAGDSLTLSPGAMPSLRVLHLENMAAPAILTPFLKGNPQNLEEIHLENCVAADSYINDEELFTWAMLWKAIRETGTKPIQIIHHQQGKNPPLTEVEVYHIDEPDWKPSKPEEAKIIRLRKMVADDDSLIIWPYVSVDDKYGSIMASDELNVGNLEKGEDNQEYNLLVDEMRKRK